MTDREIMQQAFDLLCDAVEPTATQIQADIGMCAQWDVDAIKCIDTLRQALAQPVQEPFEPDWVIYRQGVADGAAQPEPPFELTDAGADTNITRGLESKGKGMVTFNQFEPVAFRKMAHGIWFYIENKPSPPNDDYEPLYTAPPKREWIGLTDDSNGFELGLASCTNSRHDPQSFIDGAKWAEVKLKEKNT